MTDKTENGAAALALAIAEVKEEQAQINVFDQEIVELNHRIATLETQRKETCAGLELKKIEARKLILAQPVVQDFIERDRSYLTHEIEYIGIAPNYSPKIDSNRGILIFPEEEYLCRLGLVYGREPWEGHDLRETRGDELLSLVGKRRKFSSQFIVDPLQEGFLDILALDKRAWQAASQKLSIIKSIQNVPSDITYLIDNGIFIGWRMSRERSDQQHLELGDLIIQHNDCIQQGMKKLQGLNEELPEKLRSHVPDERGIGGINVIWGLGECAKRVMQLRAELVAPALAM